VALPKIRHLKVCERGKYEKKQRANEKKSSSDSVRGLMSMSVPVSVVFDISENIN
jgi:hypothetical protein